MSRLVKIVSIDEEFEKAKPYTRTSRGKLQRVKGYPGKLGGAKERAKGRTGAGKVREESDVGNVSWSKFIKRQASKKKFWGAK
jgi:hypothetical protein